jgi:hypothetical protein
MVFMAVKHGSAGSAISNDSYPNAFQAKMADDMGLFSGVSCMSMPYRNPKASYDYARRLMLDK